MEFTDSHTHLYLNTFDTDRDEVVKRAVDQGITRLYLPNIDRSSIKPMEALCRTFPNHCFPMMGLHPTSISENYKFHLDEIEKLLAKNRYAAIGEIGIDLYWDKSLEEEQTDAFRRQIRWAKESGLPIVIHARESFNEIFKVLDEEWDENLKGVFHSFTGGSEEVEKIRGYGFMLGINGIVTFKNSGLDKVVAGIKLSEMFLETDAPFLAPVPFRGKRNESAYLIKVAEKIAEIHQVAMSEVAERTTANVFNLFKI